MSDLKRSQLETLKVAKRLVDGMTGAFEAADVAWLLRSRPSTNSARQRLDLLASRGYLTVDRATPHRVFYDLTEKGRAAVDLPPPRTHLLGIYQFSKQKEREES